MDNTFALTIILLLLLGIGINLYMGCSTRSPRREGFVDSPDEAAPGHAEDDELTPKEHELFQDLVKDKLDDKDIVKMVKSNVLTERLVEKFLSKLSKEGGQPKDDKEEGVETFEVGPGSKGLAAFAAPL